MSGTAADTSGLGYRPGLDGLRAIAIAFVVLHHTADFFIPDWSGSFFPGGFLGVDIFFVLSGFLITSLILERRARAEARPLRSFYARRALRLLPAVVLLLVVNLVIELVQSDGIGRPLRSFAVVLSYTTNWAEIRSVSFSPYLSHLWSLAIEEQFYLVWPVLLLGALWLGLSLRRIAVLAVVLAGAAAFWRADLWWTGHGWLAIYIRTDARADALLVGVVLALVRPDRLMSRVPGAVRGLLGCASVALLTFAAVHFHGDSKSLYMGGFTVVALIAALLLTVELAGGWVLHPILAARPIVWIGRLSYSLYLWHFLVFQLAAEHLTGASSVVKVAIGWSATAAIAFASFALVERPALRVKDRVGRRRLPAARTRAEPARNDAA
jgi:peptidoglycan/LPS O-acetylase OafA/YrhL